MAANDLIIIFYFFQTVLTLRTTFQSLLMFLNVPQEHVVKEELLGALYCEFINRVNEVGVDVNRAIAHPYTQSLVQYICGLGPRKGSHLLKVRPFSPKIYSHI